MWSKFVRNILRNALHFLTDEVDRVVRSGTDKPKCGFVIWIKYELSCACIIVKKIKHHSFIRLHEIYTKWKRLRFEDGDVLNDSQTYIYCLPK